MTDLFVTFRDADSEVRRVRIDKEKFVIGRHSQNDLSIADSRLSRLHLKIERFADIFIATDLKSSNGTKLNGKPLKEPSALSDGDVLDLGGLEMEVEIEGDEPPSAGPANDSGEDEEGADEGESEASSREASETLPEPEPTLLGSPLFIVSLLGFALVLIIGLSVLIYAIVSGGDSNSEGAGYSTPNDFPYDEGRSPTFETSPGSTGPETLPTEGTVPSPTGEPIPTPTAEISASDKLRTLSTMFMREIAKNDPSPVITSEPLLKVSSKIDQFRGSSAVGNNIENAIAARTQIEALARSKGLKPEFLAAAALAKLGNRSGDVLQTANAMAGALTGLKIQIGDAFANECVIIIAAYDQGEKGQFLTMRDTITKLTANSQNVTARKVRTIWYLHEQGKLTEAQFEFALRFLAIGTIAQDPSQFGINAKPLRLG